MKKIELKEREGEKNVWDFYLNEKRDEIAEYYYSDERGYETDVFHEGIVNRLNGIAGKDLPIKIQIISMEEIELLYGYIVSVWIDRDNNDLEIRVNYALNDKAYEESNINPMKLRLEMCDYLEKKGGVVEKEHLKEILASDDDIMFRLEVKVDFKTEGSLNKKVKSVINMMSMAEKQAVKRMINNILKKDKSKISQ